ncbi:MAG: hypothetical protein BGO98_24190 [Myxococcales bacterium 68-20]|nr:hypothetical protein [Myxococcales bacterium]OJY15773.1 MAG: hypothetical protein BGO98_24190 [Myxococcales bacterium 68-20]
MRRLDVNSIAALTAAALFVSVGLASCTQTEAVVLREAPTPPAPFTPADASADAAPVPADVLMCPVTRCTLPSATCPSSSFPCDVDLMNDDDNCGGCGIRCGGTNVGNSKWSCVEGQCAFSCVAGFRNCDDSPANGCEVNARSDKSNCGGCGRVCAEGETCSDGACINTCKQQGLPDTCGGRCTNLEIDDRNCGTCGTECDPAGPGLPALPADMYYGCGSGKCNAAKCSDSGKSNCNRDLSDGCEATLKTNDHCTSCNDACSTGKNCLLDVRTFAYRCLCADGETLCSGIICKNLDDDPLNCGGCNHVCPGNHRPHFVPTCTFGVCSGRCEDGYADCDGVGDNGCEVDTRVDNRNCGACGNACEANQVCSAGKCLVAPCDSEGPTTK